MEERRGKKPVGFNGFSASPCFFLCDIRKTEVSKK
jgi:hypothetical protein